MLFFFFYCFCWLLMTSHYKIFCSLIWIPKCCIFMQSVTWDFFSLCVLCQGISCLIYNAHHVLPTVFLQGSQRASSHKVTSVLGHVSLLECLPPLILHLSYTDTQIFSFFATCLPETKETGRIKLIIKP